MANETYTNFLKDPDQASRRAELTAFFGPHADKFLKAYDQQVEMANRQPGQPIKWNFFSRAFVWPAFFIGPVWLFYRKMWVWGIGLTVLIIVIGLTPLGNRIGLPLGVAMASSGALLYVNHAIKQIETLRAQSPDGVLDPQRLAALGGVSKPAGWIGGIVYALLTALAIVGIVLGGPDSRHDLGGPAGMTPPPSLSNPHVQ